VGAGVARGPAQKVLGWVDRVFGNLALDNPSVMPALDMSDGTIALMSHGDGYSSGYTDQPNRTKIPPEPSSGGLYLGSGGGI
jgi:hypothetical protein